jgi:hypothetical protein
VDLYHPIPRQQIKNGVCGIALSGKKKEWYCGIVRNSKSEEKVGSKGPTTCVKLAFFRLLNYGLIEQIEFGNLCIYTKKLIVELPRQGPKVLYSIEQNKQF